MFKAWIGNLGKYNEGELVGEWLEFPCTEEEWDACMERIGIGSTDEFGQPYEEYFVADYDGGYGAFDELGEYPSYEELNEFGEKLKELDNLDDTFGEGFVSSLVEEVGDIDEVLDHVDDLIVIEQNSFGDDYQDIAYYYVDAFGDISELGRNTLETYFDYDAFGRDLGFESWENPDYDPDDPDSEEYISAGEYICGDEYASDQEIGETYVYDILGGIEELGKDTLEDYFDYEAYGRDIYLEGNFYKVKTDDYTRYWVEIPY